MNTLRVLIIYRYLPHYRAEFYGRLREQLASENIELDLIYGQDQADRLDKVTLPWAEFRPNKTIRLGGLKFIWQPCLRDTKAYDLVIVEQANRLLLNYVLLVVRRLWGFKLGFWGHGLNWQSPRTSFVNRFKERFLNLADWWFAYTTGVATLLTERGYSSRKVTVVHNSIDLRTLGRQLAERIVEVPLALKGKPVALFCGSMYEEKRMDFLLQSCDQIAARVPDFQMLFMGAGEEHYRVEAAARQRPWMHDLGPLTGDERLPYLKASQVFLMPGAVGLVILDSFASGAPLVTTDYPYHGPEIDYLVHGYNGLIAKDEGFVDTVVSLFENSEQIQELRKGCLASAELYSLEKMVSSFADGVVACLKS